ncbi:MAG: type I DNA topoisomerase [Candidatus Izemoplasmatales bacterium]|jgi:DNA topoisomerase-1|nr:type I DNA topoisomerase [Candidatus Izemoplasmatales bacterium]
MANKVVIVESPSKSKTIRQYLGKDYLVTASVGHIRDLATTGKGGLGIDVDNDFTPNYQVQPDKKKIVNELNKLISTAQVIYLATDPDREGEAISWHLYDTLKIGKKKVRRVEFNEITKDAIIKAFEHPRDIDMDLVSSQETRRMLDRIIGFKLSKLLNSKIKSKSAGRVQSAALKLIVDLEKEINSFVPEEYYEIYAKFGEIEAQLIKVNGEKADIKNKDEAEKILKGLKELFKIDSVEVKESKSYPRPALTTSALYQAASAKYKMSSKHTMAIAQKLYEGMDIDGETVGLITYMRTDSTRLSEVFIDETRHFIKDTFGSKYLGYYRKPKNADNAQDAHEAIRPTSLKRTPESLKNKLKPQEYKIYKLIYDKALGSLMSPATNEVTTVIFENNKNQFKASSSKPIFDGYLKLTRDYEDETKDKTSDLSRFKEKEEVKADEVYEKQLFTNPPTSYTEAKLIKDMEELGIGRPSTYANTLTTLQDRGYIKVENRTKLIPTEQGILTTEQLDEFFSDFISVNYSKEMEEFLDDIANGKLNQLKVLKDFYNYFMPLVENAQKHMIKLKPKETGEDCPLCGKPMVWRSGKYGEFEACSDYPTCKYIKPQEKDKSEPIDTDVTCPECKEGTLVVREAKKGKNKGNKFLACSRFPKCKYISPLKIVDENCAGCKNVVVKNDKDEVFCIDGRECDHKH